MDLQKELKELTVVGGKLEIDAVVRLEICGSVEKRVDEYGDEHLYPHVGIVHERTSLHPPLPIGSYTVRFYHSRINRANGNPITAGSVRGFEVIDANGEVVDTARLNVGGYDNTTFTEKLPYPLYYA